MIPPMLALLSWPLVVLALFRRYSVQVALCATIIGGYLLLPESTFINLPVLPTLNKHTVPVFAAILALLLFHSGQSTKAKFTTPSLPGWLPRNWLILFLLVLLFLGIFLTTVQNEFQIRIGPRTLPGLSIYDGFSAALQMAVSLVPLFLARKYLATAKGHLILLVALGVAAFCYAFPVLFEVRMSPQLHRDIYGFRATSWAMSQRGDGFRPVVFLNHGLWLGIFLSVATLAAFACFRIMKGSYRLIFLGIGIFLLATLSVSKTLGALAITLLLLPVILFLTKRLQLIAAAALAGVVLFYPMLRGADLVPTTQIVSLAEKVDPRRASSLQFRLINEDILLARANQRPLVGWGGWGRARVYNEYGGKASVTDGIWVIVIGQNGWIGYIARFGLLCIPIILLALRTRHYKVSPPTAALSVVMVANLIDLLPNATLTPITWLIAGAIIGHLEPTPQVKEEAQGVDTAQARPKRLQYSRTPPRPVRNGLTNRKPMRIV